MKTLHEFSSTEYYEETDTTVTTEVLIMSDKGRFSISVRTSADIGEDKAVYETITFPAHIADKLAAAMTNVANALKYD
jgi:hypothetical protein